MELIMANTTLSRVSVIMNVFLLIGLVVVLIRIVPQQQSASAQEEATIPAAGTATVVATTAVATTTRVVAATSVSQSATLPPPPTMTPIPIVVPTTVLLAEMVIEDSAETPPDTEETTDNITTAESALNDSSVAELNLPELDWLGYLNAFRQQAKLSPVVEDTTLSSNTQAHSNYMVQEDAIEHDEEEVSQWYSDEGLFAATSSNIVASSGADTTFNWAIDYWMSAPFHTIPLLNPALAIVGFNAHNEEIGALNMAAAIDIMNGVDTSLLTPESYPIMFPGDGSTTWVVRSSLPEWPNPLTACPDYERPVGAPIILMLGDNDNAPAVGAHRVTLDDGTEIDHCLFDEVSYVNDDAYQQKVGRGILDRHNAIVIMTKDPLQVGETYHIDVTGDGQQFKWAFTTVNSGFYIDAK
jgi:uncharacterized protein YkwD